MTDIVERLRKDADIWSIATNTFSGPCAANLEREAADEIERLQELLRGTGANRYWEGCWRDERAENERLRAIIMGVMAWIDPDNDPSGLTAIEMVVQLRTDLNEQDKR